MSARKPEITGKAFEKRKTATNYLKPKA